MSRIYFDTPNAGHSLLSGRERAWMGMLTHNVATGALGLSNPLPFDFDNDPLVKAIRPKWDSPHRFLPSALMVDHNLTFATPDGRHHAVWDVLLNTVMSVGSEPLRLLVTIHAQCEIHGWFAGPSRAHVARVIDDGLAYRVMRAGEGWEPLAKFLRESSVDPVVMSYSVCDHFPGVQDEDDERPREERWASAFEAIAAHEITPERLNDPRRWGSRLNGFDIRDAWRVVL